MKKPTLVVKQLLPRLGRVFGIGALDDGVHGARLLAEAAVDALCHVDVVARRPAGPVGALLGLDGDGLRRADGLAQLAGDAALLAAGVPPQGVLAAEPGRDGALFEGVVDRVPFETDPPTSARSQSTSRRTSLPPRSQPKKKDRRYYSRRSEELLQHHVHSPRQLEQEEVLAQLVKRWLLLLVPLLGRRLPESLWRRAQGRRVASPCASSSM